MVLPIYGVGDVAVLYETFLETPSQTCSEACFHGDSKVYQVDNEDSPSQMAMSTVLINTPHACVGMSHHLQICTVTGYCLR